MASRVLAAFREPFDLEGRKVTVSASMGAAMLPQDGSDLGVLLRRADVALYRAKVEGRGRVRHLQHSMEVQARSQRRVESELQGALKLKEMTVYYQPQLTWGTIASVVWRRWSGGAIRNAACSFRESSARITEASGSIHALDDWVTLRFAGSFGRGATAG